MQFWGSQSSERGGIRCVRIFPLLHSSGQKAWARCFLPGRCEEAGYFPQINMKPSCHHTCSGTE